MIVLPETELPLGHYAVGLTADGDEVDIYRASSALLLNVATGQAVIVTSWWKRDASSGKPSPSLLL